MAASPFHSDIHRMNHEFPVQQMNYEFVVAMSGVRDVSLVSNATVSGGYMSIVFVQKIQLWGDMIVWYTSV